MKKWTLILITIIWLATVASFIGYSFIRNSRKEPILPMKELFLPINQTPQFQASYKTWTDRYGDNDVTALAFNMAVLNQLMQQQGEAIQQLQAKIAEDANKPKKKGWF